MYALSRTWCDMTRGGKDNGIKSRRKEEGSEAQDWCSYTGTDAAVTQFPFWLGSTLSGILGSLRCHSFALSLSLSPSPPFARIVTPREHYSNLDDHSPFHFTSLNFFFSSLLFPPSCKQTKTLKQSSPIMYNQSIQSHPHPPPHHPPS